MRTGAGFVALTTRPGGRMIFSGRNEPSLIGSSSGVVRHLNATSAAERPAVMPGVVVARHLRADLAQVDGHLVAAHFDPDFDRNMLAESTPSSSMNDSAS